MSAPPSLFTSLLQPAKRLRKRNVGNGRLIEEMETDERCVEEKCKDAQNIPFTFRLRLCSLPSSFLSVTSYSRVAVRNGSCRSFFSSKGLVWIVERQKNCIPDPALEVSFLFQASRLFSFRIRLAGNHPTAGHFLILKHGRLVVSWGPTDGPTNQLSVPFLRVLSLRAR